MNRLILIALFLLVGGSAYATTSYAVSVNTTLLDSLEPGFPFSLGFIFGGGSEPGNNTVVLSDFQFGDGSANGSPALTGGATGDLSSSVTLVDTFGSSTFIEGFTAGSVNLTFLLTFTSNVDTGGTPDEFVFSILDSFLNPIPTTSPSALEPLLSITFSSANPSISTFSSGLPAIPEPVLTAAPPTVPEPATGGMLLTGLAGLFALVWRRRRRESPFLH